MGRCLYLTSRPDTALRRALDESGNPCETGNPAHAAWECARAPWSIVILDADAFGGQDAERACGACPAGAMLVVTCDADDKDLRVRLLRAGAHACLTRPFSVRELQARIQAFFRQPVAASASSTTTSPDVLVCAESQTVSLEGRSVELSRAEFAVLRLLLEADGSPCEREYLLRRAWRDAAEPDPAQVDAAVARLRQKLRDLPLVIEAVRGVGYRARGRYRLG